MIDRAAIENAASRALTATIEDLDQFYTTAIEAPIYNWPGTTLRKSGELAGTTRNSVDLGDFRDSQTYRPLNPLLYELTWDAPHSIEVFYGFTTEDGNVYPGRNPVEAAHRAVDPIELYAEYLKLELA